MIEEPNGANNSPAMTLFARIRRLYDEDIETELHESDDRRTHPAASGKTRFQDRF